jgi:hypothetical protein
VKGSYLCVAVMGNSLGLSVGLSDGLAVVFLCFCVLSSDCVMCECDTLLVIRVRLQKADCDILRFVFCFSAQNAFQVL